MKCATSLFLVGCVALVYCAFGPYPPLDNQEAMPYVFLAGLLAATAFFSERRGNRLTAVTVLIGLLPWLLAGLCLLNGGLDRSIEQRHATVVVDTEYSESGIRDRIIVQSWRPGRPTESIVVSVRLGFFHPGESVIVATRSGALGWPWVSGVFR